MALKPCKECGREISTDVTTCPHCGKTLPTGTPKAATGCAVGCLVLFVATAGIGVYASSKSTPADEAKWAAEKLTIEARVNCQELVRNRLRAPSTAKFSSPALGLPYAVAIGGGQYRAAGTYDAQNAFGAMLRGSYVCDIQHRSDGRWTLVRLVTE